MGREEGIKEQWEERQEGQMGGCVPAISGEMCSAKDELCVALAHKPKACPCRAPSDTQMHAAACTRPALPTPATAGDGNTSAVSSCHTAPLTPHRHAGAFPFLSARQPRSGNRSQNNTLVPVSE